MPLHVYNKAYFGWELRRSIDIPEDYFKEVMSRHAVRQITVGGITYYYLPTKHYSKLMETLRAAAKLLNKDIPNYLRIILVWSHIENPPETFEAFNKDKWFKELERDGA